MIVILEVDESESYLLGKEVPICVYLYLSVQVSLSHLIVLEYYDLEAYLCHVDQLLFVPFDPHVIQPLYSRRIL